MSRIESQSCKKRHTNTAVAENCCEVVKERVARRASVNSAAELLKRLTEEILQREAAGHLYPNFAHCHSNLGANLQQPYTNRANLRAGQMCRSQSQTAQSAHQRISHDGQIQAQLIRALAGGCHPIREKHKLFYNAIFLVDADAIKVYK